MRRTCTNCLVTFPLLLAAALLTACSPSDFIQMQQGGGGDGSAEADASVGEDEPADKPEREVAAVGVGKKGHYDGEGPMRTPVSQYFRLQEKIAFDIEIPHALELYKATDPQFKGPKSHEEFMEKIIQANRIALPELPEGERYEYDPQDEKLYVVRDK